MVSVEEFLGYVLGVVRSIPLMEYILSRLVIVVVLNIGLCITWGLEALLVLDSFGYVCKGLILSNFVGIFTEIVVKCGKVLKLLCEVL